MNSKLWVCLWIVLTAGTSYASAVDSQLSKRIRIEKTMEMFENQSGSLDKGTKDAFLKKKRATLLYQMETLVRRPGKSSQKLELKLRLARIYMEDYYSALAKGESPKEIDAARTLLRKPRALYSSLLAEYPNDPRRDQMLYFYGLTSLDVGLPKEAMRMFEEIATRFPKSNYRFDANIQVGDYYFEQNNFAKADGFYTALIRDKYLPLVPYAVYRRAWCAYNAGRVQTSLDYLKWVIFYEEHYFGKSRVRSEALHDIAKPLADLGQVEEAEAIYSKFDPAIYRSGIEAVANILHEKGDYNRAIALWGKLIRNDSTAPKTYETHLGIIQALKLKGDKKTMLSILRGAAPLYLEKSEWFQKNQTNQALIKDASARFEETMRNAAYEFHNEFDKTKRPELLPLAEGLYEDHLKYFPNSQHSQKIQVNLAKVLIAERNIAEAARHLAIAAKMNVDPKLAEASLEQAVKILYDSWTEKNKIKEDNILPEKSSLTGDEKLLVELSDEYLKRYKAKADGIKLRYQLATLYYQRGEIHTALQLFDAIVKENPASQQAIPSAYRVLNILEQTGESQQFVATAKWMMTKGPQEKKFQISVANIVRGSELKQIETLEKKQEYLAAGEKYMQYCSKYGEQDASLYEKALYNATVNFERAGSSKNSLKADEMFVTRFPKSSFAPEIVLRLAKSSELIADHSSARRWYESFVRNYRAHSQSVNSLRMAVLHAQAEKDFGTAEGLLKMGIQAFPSQRDLLKDDLIGLYDFWPGARERYIAFLNAEVSNRKVAPDKRMNYFATLADLLTAKTGQPPKQLLSKALSSARGSEKIILKSRTGTNSLAQFLFWNQVEQERKFREIHLTLPQKSLEQNFKRKLALLKELEAGYEKVSGTGSPQWGMGAMYRTARLYRDLAEEIAGAPVPQGLSPEETSNYQSQIQGQFTLPFREKAYLLAKRCLEHATEQSIISSWIGRCYSVASSVDAITFPKMQTFYVPPLFTSILLPQDVVLPELKDGRISGGLFTSNLLFQQERNLASKQRTLDHYLLEETLPDLNNLKSPVLISYNPLNEERNAQLESAARMVRSSEPSPTSLRFLALMTLKDPNFAEPLVKDAIRKTPGDESLHNLLGLCQLEKGSLGAARAEWLLQVARGIKGAEIQNNLGVALYLQEKETDAIEMFETAHRSSPDSEGLLNLAVLALRNRNGNLAKKHFEELTAEGHERFKSLAQVGIAVASLQNRQFDSAKDAFTQAHDDFPNDPFMLLALGHFFMEIEQDNDAAKRILTTYAQRYPSDALVTAVPTPPTEEPSEPKQ